MHMALMLMIRNNIINTNNTNNTNNNNNYDEEKEHGYLQLKQNQSSTRVNDNSNKPSASKQESIDDMKLMKDIFNGSGKMDINSTGFQFVNDIDSNENEHENKNKNTGDKDKDGDKDTDKQLTRLSVVNINIAFDNINSGSRHSKSCSGLPVIGKLNRLDTPQGSSRAILALSGDSMSFGELPNEPALMLEPTASLGVPGMKE